MPCRRTCAIRARSKPPCSDASVVINLVGILFERGRQSFEAVQAQGADVVAQATQAAGARLIHVSAIGANPNSPSLYARSKAAGEAAVREALPDATIFRPSIVFGPEDDFFNRFASLARMSPVLPLIGGGTTRFQPVYVGDVAEAIARAVEDQVRRGMTYELGGPEVRTFKELMEYVLAVTERRRLLVPLPFGLAKLQASCPAAHAEAAAHDRPGRAAAAGQRRVGGREDGRPHVRGDRHQADRDGSDRAVVSLALPQGRPVQEQRGVITVSRRARSRPDSLERE